MNFGRSMVRLLSRASGHRYQISRREHDAQALGDDEIRDQRAPREASDGPDLFFHLCQVVADRDHGVRVTSFLGINKRSMSCGSKRGTSWGAAWGAADGTGTRTGGVAGGFFIAFCSS